jgi:hypothetical protein
MKFLELCVRQRAAREAREGLNEYKKLTEKVGFPCIPRRHHFSVTQNPVACCLSVVFWWYMAVAVAPPRLVLAHTNFLPPLATHPRSARSCPLQSEPESFAVVVQKLVELTILKVKDVSEAPAVAGVLASEDDIVRVATCLGRRCTPCSRVAQPLSVAASAVSCLAFTLDRFARWCCRSPLPLTSRRASRSVRLSCRGSSLLGRFFGASTTPVSWPASQCMLARCLLFLCRVGCALGTTSSNADLGHDLRSPRFRRSVLEMLRNMWKPTGRKVTKAYINDAVKTYIAVATQTIEFLLKYERRRGACRDSVCVCLCVCTCVCTCVWCTCVCTCVCARVCLPCCTRTVVFPLSPAASAEQTCTVWPTRFTATSR